MMLSLLILHFSDLMTKMAIATSETQCKYKILRTIPLKHSTSTPSLRGAQDLKNYTSETETPLRHYLWALCGRGRVLTLQRHRIHV